MGSHTFTWPHAAQEVYVTGTFDNWQKTVKLEKHASDFHKTVDLPAEKILYKFVVDGNWTTDHTAPQETDHQGITNNVLTVDQLKSAPSSHSFLSSVAPNSSTAAMAGSVAHQEPSSPSSPSRNAREERDEVPGAFPETPANELSQFSVDPIPATSAAPVPGGEGSSNPIKLAPGEAVPESSSITSNTIDSHVKDDESLKQFSVNPIPATSAAPVPGSEGSSNPIKLAPGEAVPESSSYTSNTIGSHVKSENALDIAHNTEGTEIVHPAEEAERAFGVAPIPGTSGIGNPIKLAAGEPVPHPSTFTDNTIHSNVSDSRSATGAPQLPPMFTPGTEAEANGASMFDLPAIGSGSGPMIPESSLPMGGASGIGASDPGFTINSAGPQSTSATLAGAVPIRERGVPEVVTESEKAAHQSPEAAAYTEPVEQKSAVEEELLAKVPEAKGVDAVGHGNAETVPAAVTESQHRADVDPEASSSPSAVQDKTAMEEELKQKVQEEPATSSSGIFGASERGITGAIAGGALAAGGAIAAAAYAARDQAQPALDKAAEAAAPYTGQSTSATDKDVLPIAHDAPTAPPVPAAVTDSQHAAHVDPEASAVPEAVADKADMEKELKAAVPEEPATSESGLLGKSEGGISGKLAGGLAAGTAAAGAAVAGVAYTARDKAAETTGQDKNSILPPSIQSAIDSMNNNKGTTAPVSETVATSNGVDGAVPEQVVESQKAAHFAPEASAEPAVVAEKSAVEQELLGEVKRTDAAGEPAPALGAALTETAPSGTAASSISPPTSSSGLNAGADSQAQPFTTKVHTLAADPQPLGPSDVDPNSPAAAAVSTESASAPQGLTHSATTEPASAGEIAERATSAANVAESSALDRPPTATSTYSNTNTPLKKEKSPFDPKSDRLAAPGQETAGDSRDVSPMSKTPRGPEDETTAAAAPPTTPSKDKSKRSSSFFGGSPKTHNTEGAATPSGESSKKKKGFFAKIKEKLKG